MQTKPLAAQITPLMQRVPIEEEEEGFIQKKKAAGVSPEVTPAISSAVQSLQGGGRSLSGAERGFFEPRFRADFSKVRVHNDSKAANVARSINARAFTYAHNVVFGSGEYLPETKEGKKLLGHELTHVVQQNKSTSIRTRLQRAPVIDSDCNQAQRPLVEQALNDADSDLGTAITKLSAGPLASEVRDALWLMFRNSSHTVARRVKDRLQEIKDGLQNATVECEQTDSVAYSHFCRGRRTGYVRTIPSLLGLGNIHLCMGNWMVRGRFGRAETIMHEGSHRFNQTGDVYYFTNRGNICRETGSSMGQYQTHRLRNADSYSCIAYHLAHTPAATLTALANASGATGQHVGIGLILALNPTGPIDLDQNAHSTLFEVIGNVQGGFATRWMIHDEQDRRYLMWGMSEGTVSRFTNETTTYIPSRTRLFLKQRRVRNAYVLCRIRFSDGYTRLYRLPVNFTWA